MRTLLGWIVAIGLILFSVSAYGQGVFNKCWISTPSETAHQQMVKYLRGHGLKQLPQGLGLSGKGYILEFFLHKDSGQWSMATSHPKGRSCIVDRGIGWVFVPEGKNL